MAEIQPNTAVDAALDLPELLEQVLKQLSFVDLLKARAVSRHWQRLIETSPALKGQLFLRSYQQHKSMINNSPSSSDELILIADYPVFFHPILCSPKIFKAQVNRIANDPASSLSLPAAWRHEEALWRRMQLRQPPMKTLTLKCTYKHPFECVFEKRSFVHPNGVTGQHLVNALSKVFADRAGLRLVQGLGCSFEFRAQHSSLGAPEWNFALLP